jgi:omega-6 fatty acid desaturase (delta-12 desaturase)
VSKRAEPPIDAAFWRERLAPYQTADHSKAFAQLANTLLPFAALWWLMYEALAVGWWLTLLIAPLAALLLVRLFIFQHDCGHGSFLPSRALNNLVGSALGVLTLTPYHYWKRTHAAHHATSGNLDRRGLGDIDTLTVNEYLALPRWKRLVYHLYRNPLVLFGLGPPYQFLLKHRLPLDAPLSWRKEWRSVMLTNLALVAVLMVAWQTIGLRDFLMVQLPINLLAGPVGIWMFYVQHQFERTYWKHNDEWNFYEAGLKGASHYDLPAMLHWFTGNIGYHHLHHISSRVPNYKLAACYRTVEELQQANRLGLLQSFGCLGLKLWDEDRGRLVGFAALRS